METVIAGERERYDAPTGLFNAHRDAWFFFAHDNRVEGRSDALNKDLGFDAVAVDARAS